MAKLVDIDRANGVRALTKALSAYPERLDKEMRLEFREQSKPIRDDARAKAQRARPHRTTPKHKGDYHWKQVVNAISSSASGDSPTLRLETNKYPGVAGWEFGSNKLKNFERRNPAGYFFFPTVEAARPLINEAVEEIALRYAQIMLGDI